MSPGSAAPRVTRINLPRTHTTWTGHLQGDCEGEDGEDENRHEYALAVRLTCTFFLDEGRRCGLLLIMDPLMERHQIGS